LKDPGVNKRRGVHSTRKKKKRWRQVKRDKMNMGKCYRHNQYIQAGRELQEESWNEPEVRQDNVENGYDCRRSCSLSFRILSFSVSLGAVDR
jgi:hypothetical protein